LNLENLPGKVRNQVLPMQSRDACQSVPVFRALDKLPKRFLLSLLRNRHTSVVTTISPQRPALLPQIHHWAVRNYFKLQIAHSERQMLRAESIRGVTMKSMVRALSWLLLVFLVFTGCKKQVTTAPPALPVQAVPPPPTPAITLRAMPTVVDRGQSVGLQWEARNASNVRIEPEVGTVQTQGVQLVNPSSSVTYVATATGPGGSASDSARITVRVPPPAAPAATKARPPAVNITDLFKQNVQAIYFDYDDSEIRPDQVFKLNAAAAWLRERRDLKFTIEGDCDDRGSEEYNLGLGDRRANRVKEYLVQQGIDASRMRTVSYGEERPACRETTEACYQRNRRAEFVLGPTT
jgi:peptidoglycan-associated lipoprotein